MLKRVAMITSTEIALQCGVELITKFQCFRKKTQTHLAISILVYLILDFREDLTVVEPHHHIILYPLFMRSTILLKHMLICISRFILSLHPLRHQILTQQFNEFLYVCELENLKCLFMSLRTNTYQM